MSELVSPDRMANRLAIRVVNPGARQLYTGIEQGITEYFYLGRRLGF
jgi:hypothetical protein